MTIDTSIETLQAMVIDAIASGTKFRIIGNDTKAFYGREVEGELLQVGHYQGVLSYEPTELVITARAGTPLTEIEALLAEHGQMLAFEPPQFGDTATIGGVVASGLSGPRRPYSGAVRDFVLGVTLINGRGEVLRFGGQVMKNVAGYDISRLMAGSLGTLGILLEISIKVLPRPAREITVVSAMHIEHALDRMNAWAGQPWPLSAACFHAGKLYVRLSGSGQGVAAAGQYFHGSIIDDGDRFWGDLSEQRLPFFADERPLWRLSVPPATDPLPLDGDWLVDWGGAQRWFKSDQEGDVIRAAAGHVGGHATLFRGGDRRGEVFHPLAPGLAALTRRIKQAFDPHGLFNPGRLYPLETL